MNIQMWVATPCSATHPHLRPCAHLSGTMFCGVYLFIVFIVLERISVPCRNTDDRSNQSKNNEVWGKGNRQVRERKR